MICLAFSVSSNAFRAVGLSLHYSRSGLNCRVYEGRRQNDASQMKETIFMRVLFCKIHCPLMCFCKPSAAHIYTSGPLKLESAEHTVPSTAFAVSGNSCERVNEEHVVLKSCIRKPTPRPEAGKKSVQWMDMMGKELAEIKEFECSDSGDTDNEEESNRCLCIIL